MAVSIVAIVAIFFIVIIAVGVCLMTLYMNHRIDSKKEQMNNQIFQQDMALKQIQLCKEAGIPLMFNQQMPQMQMPPTYSANSQQTPAYSVKLLGR